MDTLFKKELLTNLAGLAVAVPDGEPLVLEDPEHDLVPLSTIPEDVFPQTTFDLVAAVKAVSETALVECNNIRPDLAQTKRVERVVEEEHLGIRAVSLAPVLPFTDECPSDGRTVDPVHLVHAHDTDRLAIFGLDDKVDPVGVLANAIEPALFLFLGERKSVGNESTNLRIVDPLREKGNVRLLWWTKVSDLATEKNYSILCHSRLLERTNKTASALC